MGHVPVLLNEMLEHLAPKDREIYFDGTFGGGGYSRAILESCDCKVIASDRDENVIPIAKKMLEEFGDRLLFFHSKYTDIYEILQECGIDKIDGIVLDLGVSSFQLDNASRGFSFNKDGELDMRMGINEKSALDVIRELSESKLADVIYTYGEERFSRRISKAIKSNIKSIKTTTDLANIVRHVTPRNFKKDPATKTFQALRIFVNNELGELEYILKNSAKFINLNGRFVVVSFHSLEDRIVKNEFLNLNREQKSAKIITKKPVSPSDKEVEINVRSRSAKLRAISIID